MSIQNLAPEPLLVLFYLLVISHSRGNTYTLHRSREEAVECARKYCARSSDFGYAKNLNEKRLFAEWERHTHGMEYLSIHLLQGRL